MPRLRALRSELSIAEERLGSLLLRAPRDGHLLDLAVVSGEPLQRGDRVATLAPAGEAAQLDAVLPARYAQQARFGRRGTVLFADGGQRAAEVIGTAPPADRGQDVVQVRMRLLGAPPAEGVIGPQPVRVRLPASWRLRAPPWVARFDGAVESQRRPP